MSNEEFLDRCSEVYKLLDGLKESTLRAVVTQIGVPEDEIQGFRSLKLLATTVQLAVLVWACPLG